ncbi:hypothetical protein D9M72_472040 [compost metagenome]
MNVGQHPDRDSGRDHNDSMGVLPCITAAPGPGKCEAHEQASSHDGYRHTGRLTVQSEHRSECSPQHSVVIQRMEPPTTDQSSEDTNQAGDEAKEPQCRPACQTDKKPANSHHHGQLESYADDLPRCNDVSVECSGS